MFKCGRRVNPTKGSACDGDVGELLCYQAVGACDMQRRVHGPKTSASDPTHCSTQSCGWSPTYRRSAKQSVGVTGALIMHLVAGATHLANSREVNITLLAHAGRLVVAQLACPVGEGEGQQVVLTPQPKRLWRIDA